MRISSCALFLLAWLSIVAASSADNPKKPETITNSIGMKLALIPAGEFVMGAPEGEDKEAMMDEKQHRVRITRPFYMGIYTVTQSEYEKVTAKDPSYFSRQYFKRLGIDRDTNHFPVEMVSWDDAQEFCRKLSEKEGKTYRLPTEAEWEYACRAGKTTAFSWGNTINGSEANCNGNLTYGTSTKGPNLSRTCQVGSYPSNAFGLFDVHGNVRQWCSDWLDDYPKSPMDDPKGPATGADRVQRGSSWANGGRVCRSAFRSGESPKTRDAGVGIRVVCEK